jgi:hypothetical protein
VITLTGTPWQDTFSAGLQSGTASIQIDALDSAQQPITGGQLTRSFQISAAPSSATNITVQSNVTTVAPKGIALLTATVRDASNNTVGNAPVLFELVNPTGSGETLSPVVQNTLTNGVATSTLTAGSLPTTGGLQIKASVINTAINATTTINVGGSAVSVTLGEGNKMTSVNNDTDYQLPMSVLVVDNAGAAVAGAVVTLKAFPPRFFEGTRDTSCNPQYNTAPYINPTGVANNDTNENDILDPGEYDYATPGWSIVPPHASAGSVPTSVTTDANGVGTFNLIFQKQYASWVQTRIRASVLVSGTESTSELKFILPVLIADTNPCTLPNSPFNGLTIH